MDSLNQSLIEKLESAHASLFNNNAVESAYCSGFGAALSIVREYKPSEISVVDEPDKLIMACEEVLRHMAHWRNGYRWNDNAVVRDRAVTSLRSEMQKYLRTREPVAVSLEKCGDALAEAWNLKYPRASLNKGAKAVLDAAGVKYVD